MIAQGVLIVAIFCGLSASQATDDFQKIHKFFSNRCQNNAVGGNHFKTLEDHTKEFLSYAEYAFALLPKDYDNFCKSESFQLANRVRRISQDMKPCLNSDEQKFLPQFFINTFDEFLKFLCDNNAKNIKTFFNIRGEQCRSAIEADTSMRIDDCFSRIFAPIGRSVKPQELCDDIGTAKKCFAQQLERDCPNNDDYKRMNGEFFGRMSETCLKSTNSGSSVDKTLFATLALITAALLTTKYI